MQTYNIVRLTLAMKTLVSKMAAMCFKNPLFSSPDRKPLIEGFFNSQTGTDCTKQNMTAFKEPSPGKRESATNSKQYLGYFLEYSKKITDVPRDKIRKHFNTKYFNMPFR